ncbi:MAG: hypothetical protein M1832_001418 [Thelocarpon impressellum]|nr:MAG: hypothetical protein M1832_001418 [Thelocarpon impressellum]
MAADPIFSLKFLPSHVVVLAALAISLFSVLFVSKKGSGRLALPLVRRAWPGRLRHVSTLPRTPPPGKTALEAAATADFKDVFPPSRRGSLAKIITQLPAPPALDLASSPDEARSSVVPLTASIDDLSSPAYTPTAFSTEDVKALGDFPDYAELSGVPLPQPYPNFDIKTALARPYRPLRWAYHQTMSLTKLEPDWWLELEKDYASRIRQRQALVAEHGTAVLNYLPGSELACKELMEMCLQFLCARYPHYFSLSADKTTFRNGILQNETRLKEKHPLLVLLDNVPEDFALMFRDPDDGFYYFRAGVICSALGWNVETKLGLQLHQIHAPIPDYKEKMRFSMDRYFSRLPTDRPIQRGSWGLEIDQPLFMPPGDPLEANRESQQADLTLSRCHLRVDWQTLRRLPLSGAIVFNFKALFTPVEHFRHEPYIPALCARNLRDGKKSLMRYKNTWHVEHVVVPALERMAREQVAEGVVEEGWEEQTLRESPWFPGWEEQWQREQGFA